MEPVVRLALLCDYALRSQDGKLSAIGIFSHIGVSELPGAAPPFFVALTLALDRGEHQVRFGLLDPMGQEILPDPPVFDVDVEMPGIDTELMLQFNGIPLSRPGIHQIQLFVDGRLIHSIPLTVQGTDQGPAGRA